MAVMAKCEECGEYEADFVFSTTPPTKEIRVCSTDSGVAIGELLELASKVVVKRT
ncbi:MAG: hypothetical protein ACLQD8_00220 [Thermoplasmata archaeon]